MKIDWIRKISSRKFWVCVVGFITSILIAFKVDEGSIAQITSIIMSGATLITYILSEAYIDASKVGDDDEP